jgi:2-dehydropantoate 2-reductase
MPNQRKDRVKMKVLVYGAGVIGAYLTHILCAAGNDVYVLARGARKTELEKDGLVIRHHLQKKATVDRPNIVERLSPDEHYDAVFAVMQYQQMWAILDDLATCASPLVVLVGNNMSAPEMERRIHEHSPSPKTVAFGFQPTGGRRENGEVICVRKGVGRLSCGFLHSEPDAKTKALLSELFAGTEYKPFFVSDMDAWYKNHLAFILPAAYVCYATDCDLKRATKQQRRSIMSATLEGYRLLEALGYPIMPEDSMEYFEGGFKKAFMSTMLFIVAKTTLGKLAASDHCRNAVTEMRALDEAFRALREQKPDFPMPVWSELEKHMP